MSFWSHTHTYTKSGDSNTCENSYVHAALPSMPICTSALLHVFLVTHTYLYKVRLLSGCRRVYRGSCKTSCLLLRGCRRVYRGSCNTSCLLLRGCRRVYRGSCKSSCLLLRGCRGVYRGSCKTSCLLLRGCRRVYRGNCNTYVDVAVSIGEAAKPCVFWCVDVAVSIKETATPRVICCVDVAVSIGEAAKPRVFCCVDVAVSIGEAALGERRCALLPNPPPTFSPKRQSMRICKPTVLFVFFPLMFFWSLKMFFLISPGMSAAPTLLTNGLHFFWSLINVFFDLC